MKIMGKLHIAGILVLAFIVLACDNNKPKPVYVESETSANETSQNSVQYASSGETIAVPFREENGVKYLAVKINGLGCDMILDTGCSDALISAAEANYLYEKGEITEADILGTSSASIADGSIVTNAVINLREVVIAERIVCNDVKASVTENPGAALLLGNEILDRAASFTIDNENKIINFTLK